MNIYGATFSQSDVKDAGKRRNDRREEAKRAGPQREDGQVGSSSKARQNKTRQ